jgi:hypothetical protein
MVVDVFRAPMRSRSDAVDAAATIDRALRIGVVGFGRLPDPHDERLAQRVDRFAAAPDNSFVWTRDSAGLYRLGQITGPYRFDDQTDALATDLVHIRPCRWLDPPRPESEVPAAVSATFARGGRNFQQIHDAHVGEQTRRRWHEWTCQSTQS